METPDPPERPEENKAAIDFTSAQHGFHDRVQSLADVELILSPNRWPRRPFLCLAHRSEMNEGGLPQEGLIYEKYPNCVFPVNIYEIPMFGGSMAEAEFMARKIEYGSPEEILRDWNID